MDYAIFGPFNFEEAVAITTCDPLEVPFWKTKTYLEDAGSSALNFGGVKARCRSDHFADNSTVKYRPVKMILGQIDEPLKGFYVCSEKAATIFSKGFNKLIDEKLNPKSKLNEGLNKRRQVLEEEIKKSSDTEIINKIKLSEILDTVDRNILHNLRKKSNPSYKSEAELIKFIEDFYPKNLLGRYTYIGQILFYFNLPVNYLIKPAIKEHIEFAKKIGRHKNIEFLEEYFKKDSEKRLFG